MELNKYKLIFFALSHLIQFILSQFLIFCQSTNLSFQCQGNLNMMAFHLTRRKEWHLAEGPCSQPHTCFHPFPPLHGNEISLITVSLHSLENLQGLPIARGPGFDLKQQDVWNHPEPAHCGGSHCVCEWGWRPAGHKHEGQRWGRWRGWLERLGRRPVGWIP